MTPLVRDRKLHFAAYGLYQGLSLLADLETQSYWDHITGECIRGEFLGEKMDVHPLLHTRADLVCQEYPQAQLAISTLSWRRDFMTRIMRFAIKKSWLPPMFQKQFKRTDERLDAVEMGLGIWRGKDAKFYPEGLLEAGPIQETWKGITLTIRIHPVTQIPVAEVQTEGKEKEILQVHSMWYGFVATFPQTEIYSEEV